MLKYVAEFTGVVVLLLALTWPTKDGVRAMDELLIDNWNSVIGPDDEVWNLGDAAFTCGQKHAEDCLRRLNGKHHFVEGKQRRQRERENTVACLHSQSSPSFTKTRTARTDDDYDEDDVVVAIVPRENVVYISTR